MTLLSMAEDVAAEVGFDLPANVATGTTADERQLLRMFNRASDELLRMHPWSTLRTYDNSTISLVASQQSYNLPADFDRLIPDTFWDTTNDRRVSGGITPGAWATGKGVGVTPVIYKRFQLLGTTIEFLDAIDADDAGDKISIYYVSKNHCQSAGGTNQSAFAANTDTTRLDSFLLKAGVIWRFRRAKGLEWQSYRMDFQSESARRHAQDVVPTPLNLSGGFAVVPRNIPEGNYPGG